MRKLGVGLLWIIVGFNLSLGGFPEPSAWAQDAEEAAELKVMERFLSVLE